MKNNKNRRSTAGIHSSGNAGSARNMRNMDTVIKRMARGDEKKREIKIRKLVLFVLFWAVTTMILNYFSPMYTLEDVPAYDGAASVTINKNRPDFTEEDMTTEAFEIYAPLDILGRCGQAIACVGEELMPTEGRGDISSVYPTGWEQNSYDFVDGNSLYNRCHLIGFQLTGENANERNLITGTRYMNVEGMLPYENMIADYIKETGNHVLYRVTPIFEGSELVARGVQLEAASMEDKGEGVFFNVYVYNVQPGVEIDYATGENWAVEDAAA